MPAWEAAALVEIEAELAFEVLVNAFGAPAFLEAMDELDEGHPLVGREVECCGPSSPSRHSQISQTRSRFLGSLPSSSAGTTRRKANRALSGSLVLSRHV
jgi:hypothetical protein